MFSFFLLYNSRQLVIIMNEQYKNTLIEIEDKIKNCKNNEKYLNQLKKDREYILNCFSFKDSNNGNFDFNIKDTKEEINSLIITNQLYCSFLPNISFVKFFDIDLSETEISDYVKNMYEMIEEGKEVELNCHFCNKNYVFSVDELKELVKNAR